MKKKRKEKKEKEKFIGGFGNLLLAITDNLHIIACILLSVLCLIGYRELDEAVDYSGSSI